MESSTSQTPNNKLQNNSQKIKKRKYKVRNQNFTSLTPGMKRRSQDPQFQQKEHRFSQQQYSDIQDDFLYEKQYKNYAQQSQDTANSNKVPQDNVPEKEQLITSEDMKELIQKKEKYLKCIKNFAQLHEHLKEGQIINTTNRKQYTPSDTKENFDPVQSVLDKFKGQLVQKQDKKQSLSAEDHDHENNHHEKQQEKNMNYQIFQQLFNPTNNNNTNNNQFQNNNNNNNSTIQQQQQLNPDLHHLQHQQQQQQQLLFQHHQHHHQNQHQNQQNQSQGNYNLQLMKSKVNKYQKAINELIEGKCFEGSGNGGQYIVSKDILPKNSILKISIQLSNINNQIDIGIVRQGEQFKNTWENQEDLVSKTLLGGNLNLKRSYNMQCYSEDHQLIQSQLDNQIQDNDTIDVIVDQIKGEVEIRTRNGGKYYKSEEQFKPNILSNEWYLIVFLYKSKTKFAVTDSQQSFK